MEAASTDRKTFQLTDNGQWLGELVYENLFFMKGVIRLSDSDVYHIKPLGIFGTSISISKDELEVANLKMNWRGQIVLSFTKGDEYVLKSKGTFQDKYVIENKEGERLLVYNPHFNWKKFNYNYTITYDNRPDNLLFVLIGVYACNYFIAAMSGIFSGTS